MENSNRRFRSFIRYIRSALFVSVRWVCLWWRASLINTWHCVQTWPQTAQTLQLFKEWPQPFLPFKFHDDDNPERHSHAWCGCVCTCVMVRPPEAQVTSWDGAKMFKRGDSVRPRGLSLGMKSIPGCSWGECTLFILFVIFGFGGGFSCLSRGDRSGHPQSCNQGLFVCARDWDGPGAAWRDRAGFYKRRRHHNQRRADSLSYDVTCFPFWISAVIVSFLSHFFFFFLFEHNDCVWFHVTRLSVTNK